MRSGRLRLILSDRLKSSAHRIGDGNYNRAQRCGLGALECSGKRLKRCAGGHHVIDDDYVLSADGFWVAKLERLAQIFHALGARVHVRLRFGVALAGGGMDDGNTAPLGNSSRDEFGLVVAASELPPAMQGDGNESLRFSEQAFDALLLEQPVGKPLTQRPMVVVFELMNQIAQRLFENSQPQDTLEMGDAGAFAVRAGRALLCDRQAAEDALSGVGKFFQVSLTFLAKRLRAGA